MPPSDKNPSSERRRHKRLAVRLPVGVYKKDAAWEVIDAEIRDISEQGAFVSCSSGFPLGEEVLVEIRIGKSRFLPGKVIEWDAESKTPPPDESQRAIVRWSGTNPGFGIEFVNLDAEKKRYLQKLIHYLEKRLGQAPQEK